MSLEGFSKRGMELGNNPEDINETKNDLRQQYLSAIKRLALDKMKNDILFEGKLGATIRNLSSMGLNITRENIIKDIETEITRQKSDLSWNEYVPQEDMKFDVVDETKTQIDSLKNNLSSIFESTPIQEPKQIYTTGGIPREPVMQSPENYGIPRNDLSQVYEEPIKQAPAHTEEEKQEIKEQLQQAQEEMKQQLEWAKQQPNVPQFTSTHSDNIEPTPEWTNDYGVSGYITPSVEQVKNGLNSQLQNEESFDEIYDLEIRKLTELKRTNNPNYEIELTNTVRKLSSLTDKISDFRSQIESDIDYYMSNVKEEQQIKTPIQQVSQEESKKILQDQQRQMKDQIINQIMGAMNNAGEFSFGDISMGERMSIMQNVQNKLNAKSMDELQMLLSTYQEQNTQEENLSNGMRR